MKLLKEKGILDVATLRNYRMKGYQNNLISEKELRKKGSESYDFSVEANSGVIIVKWYSNNCVQLMSNYLTNETGTSTRRWNKNDTCFEEVERPTISRYMMPI